MARPELKINWVEVSELIEAGCDGVEIAATLGMNPDTLYKRCEKDHKMCFSAYLQIKRAKGNASILKAQFDSAIKEKNISMQIWLGKQRLGQSDRSKTDHTTGGEKINSFTINVVDEETRQEVIKLMNK